MDVTGNGVIYAVTEHGQDINETGEEELLKLYAGVYPGRSGIPAIVTGPDLNGPACLAGMLETHKSACLVAAVLSREILSWAGDGPDGVSAAIRILEKAGTDGRASWEALSQAAAKQ